MFMVQTKLVELIDELHAKHGGNLPKPRVTFTDRKVKRRVADYSFIENRIRFFTKWLNAPWETLENTARHEFAHFLQRHDSQGCRETAHGPVWQRIMVKLGGTPRAIIPTHALQPTFHTSFSTPVPPPTPPQPPQPPQLNDVTARMRELWLKTRMNSPTGSYMNSDAQ